MLKMGRLLLVVGFLVTLAVLAPGGPAVAGTCGSSSSCTFDLTVPNVTNFGPIDVRVIWDNTGGTTVFSVQWISGGPGTPGFINEFGFNAAATVTAVTYQGNNVTGAWTLNGSGTIDGFGSFASDEGNGPTAQGSREGIVAPILFTLSSKITSIPDTTAGTEFVAHVGGYSTGCSTFVGETGSTPGTSTNTSCTPAVPEPATLLLVGTGLAGFAFFGRKRWARKGGPVTT